MLGCVPDPDVAGDVAGRDSLPGGDGTLTAAAEAAELKELATIVQPLEAMALALTLTRRT